MLSFQRRPFVHARWARTLRRMVLCFVPAAFLLPLAILVGSCLAVSSASAASYYWFGDNNNTWSQIVGPGGTNWSSSPDFNNGTGGATALPGSGDDVFFVLAGAGNLNTQLGANFSIQSLTFTPDATSPIQINDTPGTDSLTIGTGGITVNGPSTATINASVVLGAGQTWANNTASPFTVNGIISGLAANNLTLGGTGLFTFGGANTYSGATSIFTGGLTLSGNGSILNTSAISLNAGTSLTLDNTTTNANRLASTVGISSSGGFITLLGNSSAPTAQSAGTLAMNAGATYVTVTPGSGQSAALTFGSAGVTPSFSHAIGGTVTFSSTGTINAPNVTLANTAIPANAIIGGWAAIGTTGNASSNTLDWATVNGSGQVVPLASYQPLAALPAATDNAQGTAATGTVTFAGAAANAYTVNTLSFNGAGYGLKFTNNTDVVTIGSGGIFSTNATGTGNYDNKLATPNMTFVGAPDSGTVNVGGTVAYNGRITSGFFPTSTTAELDVFTAANGNLRLYSLIQDPDATHKLWLVKSGPGLLDLSGGNTQNNKSSNTFTGNVMINEGILLINNAPNLGNPAAGQANTVVFNGGELRTFAGITTTAGNGWTVGTRGGTFTYTGGGTSNIQNTITGVGGFTYYSRAFGGGTNELLTLANNNSATGGNNNYQGPTNLFISLSTDQTQFGRIGWNRDNQVPATSAVTLSVVDDTAARNQVTNANTAGNPASVSLANANGNHSDHFGSLAGNLNIRNFNATLTIGANNLSTVYTGSLYGNSTTALQADTSFPAGTGTLVKVGTGTQTFAGTLNNWTGPTNINGGTLLIGSGTGTTSTAALLGTGVVNVGNGVLTGALGGNGSINGNVTVTSTGHLAPAMSSSTFNTLTLNNADLTINAGGALDYNFGTPGSGDLINLTGTGNLSLAAGTDVLNISQLTGFGIGLYPLITVTGTFTDAATFTINGKSNFNYLVLKPGAVIDPSAGGGTVPAGMLALEVLQGNPNLTWIGNLSNAWDINTTANWSGDATKFTTGANVIFDDFATGGHNNPIAVVAGGVNANSIVFNGSGTGAGGQDFTFSGGAITVNTSITKNQAGSVTFNNNVTTPTTIISAGGFIVGASAVYNSSNKLDLNGGTLTVNGTLNTPALTVKSLAILNVSSGGLLGSGTLLSNSGAATFSQPTQTLAGISGAGSLALNGSALTLAGLSSYSGQISGIGSLKVNGASADVTLSGNNTYTGGTSVQAGFLRAGSLTAFGTNPALAVSGAGTLDINGTALNGSIYNVSVGGAGVGGNGAIVNNGAAQTNALANLTLTADATLGGTTRFDIRPVGTGTATVTGGGFNLNKTGANTVGLATGNTLVSGVKDINVNQGTLVVADSSTVNNTVAGSIILNPTGTFSVGNYASLTGVVINKPFVMNGGALQTDSTGTNGNATLTTGISLNAVGNLAAQTGSTLTLNGAITNGTSSTSGVSYSGGGGTIALGVASNYGGPTVINGPTVKANSGADNTLPIGTALTVNVGGLDLNGKNQQVASLGGTGGAITNGVAGATTLTVSGSTDSQFSGSIANGVGTVSLVKSGASNLTLSGPSNFSGGTIVSAGTLSVGGAGSPSVFNPLGTGSVTLAGGTLALKGQSQSVAGLTANLYSNVPNGGVTTGPDPDYASLSALTTHLASLGAPTVSVPTSTNGKTNLDFSNNAYGNAAPFGGPTAATTANYGFFNTTNYESRFTGFINITTLGTYTFSTTSDDGSMLFIDGQDTPVVSNNNFQGATTQTGTVNFTTTGYHQIDVGFFQGTGGQGLLVAYTPPGGTSTTIPNSVLATAGSTFAGTQIYANNFVVSSNTTVDVSNSLSAVIGPVSIGANTLNLTGTAGARLATGNVTLSGNATLDQATGTTLALGAVGETGTLRSITKTGLGALNLTAAGTYSGVTNINAGELRVTNTTGSATGSGTTTIASAATLSGTGTAGAVLLNGHLSPGVGTNAIGTIGMGTTTFGAGSNLDLDFSSSANDLANVGALTLGGNVNVNLNLASGFTLGTYTLVNSTGITGASSFTVTHSGPGDNPAFASLYNVSKVGNNLALNVTAPVQTWKGNTSAAWNTTDVNWTPTTLNGGKYADNLYQEVFDDNGAGHASISIPTSVSPLAVKFANTNAVPYTIAAGSAPIAGAGVVVIAGPGIVNLNSSNTYTGGTNLQGGTLNLGDPAGNPIGSGVLIIAGGTINNTSGSSMSLANGGEIWSGSFTFTGTNDLDPGSGPITLTANPTVTVANPTASFLIDAAAIGDGGKGYGFTKAGPGTLLLSAANNTYSGTTTLTNGTLQVLSGGTLGGGSAPLTVTGGTLNLNGTNQSVGSVYTSAGMIQSGTLTATAFTVDNPADLAMDNSLVLAGSGLLTKLNTGMLTLAGMNNSYSGGTTINQGTVSISADVNLGAPATLTLNGGTLLVTAGTAANAAAGTATLSAGRDITLGANGGTISIGFTNPTLTLASETALVYNGVISGPGGLTVVGITGIDQPNQSILDISAKASYQGNTTINNAVVQVNSGTTGANAGAAVVNVLPTTTVLNLVNNGAWNIDSAASNLTVAGLTGDATGRFGTTNATTAGTNLTISGSGTYTFPGVIGAITVAGKTGSNTILSLTMNGTGTQILGGVNTYTGGTTVNKGTLALGIANGINSGSPLVLGGGKLATGGFNQSLNTLTLSASSAIDLGAGPAAASVFNFADSHLVAWTASSNLSIFNWSGNLSGGGNDQLIFGIDNTGLTSTQVGQIHFQGFNGATILGNGEVVPQTVSTRVLGDWNLNGSLDKGDISAMLSALTDLNTYQSSHSFTTDDLLNIGDVNLSGSITNADIQAELDLAASHGLGSVSAVPEPASWLLLGLGGVIFLARRRSQNQTRLA